MRKNSKLLSLLLTLCMVINMMPSMIFAEGDLSSQVIMEENLSTEEGKLEEDTTVEEDALEEEQPTEEDSQTEEEQTQTEEEVQTEEPTVEEEVLTEENTEEETKSSKDIVIMHTNDIHSRVDENLGYASVKGWKNQFESEGNDVLLLDAGDTLHGLPIANLSNGSNIVKIMNEVGYDAMTTGNHDYNYGINGLLRLKNEMNFDLLVSNVTKDGANAFTSSNIYEKGGKKIGVVGVATPETATKTNPANVAGYKFNEDKLAQIVQGEINSLKAQGADHIVALGHLGVDDESSPYKSTDLIKDVNGLDIFVDGHSHTRYENGTTVKDKSGDDVVIVQTGDYAKEIGKVVIKEDGTIKASLIKEKNEDAETAALIKQMKSDIKPQLDKVVGKTDVVLDGSRDPGVRTKETNLANLVTDGLKYVSGADVALTNGGGIRTSVDVGDITYGELNAVLPFGNVVTTIEVTGDQIVKALEHGTKNVPEASGAFPQVSGITYEIHAYSKENRVRNVQINGQAVELNKTYKLATNDFMAVGGDGYEMFKSAKKLGEFGAMDEALISYIEQLPNSTVGEEYASEQGRINIYLEEGQVPVIPLPDPEEGGPVAPTPGEEGNGGGTTNPGDGNGGTKPGTDGDESPQTGDENSIIVPVAIGLVSMVVLGAIVINRKKIAE